jgi:hypothetical protein
MEDIMTVTLTMLPLDPDELGHLAQSIAVAVHPTWTTTTEEPCDLETIFVHYLDGPSGGNA